MKVIPCFKIVINYGLGKEHPIVIPLFKHLNAYGCTDECSFKIVLDLISIIEKKSMSLHHFVEIVYLTIGYYNFNTQQLEITQRY